MSVTTATRPSIAQINATDGHVTDIRADGVLVIQRPELTIGELPFALYVVQARNAVRRRILMPSPALERLSERAGRELGGMIGAEFTYQARAELLADWTKRFAAVGIRLPDTYVRATVWCQDIGRVAADARHWAATLGRELLVA